MKFNKIRWCFVNKSGSVARLSFYSDYDTIKHYIQSNKIHWVEL